MRLEEHYLNLRGEFSHYSENESFHITINEISVLLYCTERNAKLIIKNMNESNWIKWEVFRGRGKKPLLTFLITKAEMEHLFVKDLLNNGKYTEVIEKLNHYHLKIKDDIQKFLNNYFGFFIDTEADTNNELDILRYPLHQKIINLNPTKGSTRQEYQLIKLIYDTLLHYDPVTQSIKPNLCFYWEHNQDGTQWYLHLRKGVYFHNGDTLDAESVVYSLNRIKSLHGTQMWSGIIQIKSLCAISKHILKITLHQPSFLLLNVLCNAQTSIIPKDWDENINNVPVGSGPFKVIYYTEEKTVLAAHEQYFNIRPHMDIIELLYLSEKFYSESLLFRYTDMRSEETENLTKSEQTINATAYFSINSRNEGIHNDPAFRKAFDMIIGIYKSCIDEDYRPAADSFLYNNEETHESECNDNRKKIDHLLTKANYKQEPIHLYVFYFGGVLNQLPYAKKIAELSKVYGIQLEVTSISVMEELDFDEVINDADIVLVSLVIQEDVVLSLYSTFIDPTGFIYNTLDDDKQIRLLQRLTRITMNNSQEEQLQELLIIEKELKEAHEILFLSHLRFDLFYKDNLEGLGLFLTRDINYSKVWFKKD